VINLPLLAKEAESAQVALLAVTRRVQCFPKLMRELEGMVAVLGQLTERAKIARSPATLGKWHFVPKQANQAEKSDWRTEFDTAQGQNPDIAVLEAAIQAELEPDKVEMSPDSRELIRLWANITARSGGKSKSPRKIAKARAAMMRINKRRAKKRRGAKARPNH
jgi:hypothetical protein